MTAKKPRLTDAGARVLHNIAEGRPSYYGITGRSAFGGLGGTMLALKRHGWLARDEEVTDAGREALAAYDARQRR